MLQCVAVCCSGGGVVYHITHDKKKLYKDMMSPRYDTKCPTNIYIMIPTDVNLKTLGVNKICHRAEGKGKRPTINSFTYDIKSPTED